MLVAVANWGRLLRQATRIGLDLLARRSAQRRAPSRGSGPRSTPSRDRARTVVYDPHPDGAADPGEIVWAWVPFEEGDGRGKDRPLLVVGRDDARVLALMLSSQDDRADDPDWLLIGAGSWDRQGRESSVRLDRVLEIGEQDIRREAAVLDRERFDRVARRLRQGYGWS